jgi:hypothetical protein
MVKFNTQVLVRMIWWLGLAWLWGAFWYCDLRFSKAADIILLVPLAGVASKIVGGKFQEGVFAGLFVVWLYFLDRSRGVGCVGMSPEYKNMINGTLVAFLALAIHYYVGLLRETSESATIRLGKSWR